MKTPINQLPEPKLIESDYQATLLRIRNNYQTATGHYPGINDPETFQLEQIAFEREMLVDEINFEGKQNLLPFAKGAKLDNLGALVDCERLKPTASHAMFEFEFVDGHGGGDIPKGFAMVAKDGKTVFISLETVQVPRGTRTLLLPLYCDHVGPQANNFAAGSITQISAPIPSLIQSVINTTMSIGGSNEESDSSYAERIYLAPSAFSVAGPFDAYEYFARSVHPSIINVKVLSPEPNHIDIYILLRDQQVPSQTLLDDVKAFCNQQKRRPIGDVISVMAAVPDHVSTSVHLKIYADMQSMATNTVSAVRDKLNALTKKWMTQLGRDVVPQALTAEAQVLNAVYLAETSLTFRAIAQHQYPVVTVTDITYEIVDERTE
ncbi:TPA: baseplate J/gp47 family protein [Photobacterium damselae]